MTSKSKKPAGFVAFLNHHLKTVASDRGDIINDDQPLTISKINLKKTSDRKIVAPRKSHHQLKHWLIPSEENNYQPHALHPKRVAFYAGSSIVAKALVVLTAVSIPASAWLTPDSLKAQAYKIINLTNEIRQRVGVTPLAENPQLSQAAYDKAQDMLLNQYFAHVSPNKIGLADWLKKIGYAYQVAGENLAMGFSDAPSVVEAWTKSPTHYANLIDADYSEIGVGVIAGAYHRVQTTLVAQYFGRPLIVPTRAKPLTKAIAAPPATKLNLALQAVYQQAINQQQIKIQPMVKPEQVLSDKTPTSAQPTDNLQPRLLNPLDNTITNVNNINFDVWAPQAGSVSIYQADKIIASIIKPISQDSVRLTAFLAAGQYQLKIAATINGQIHYSTIYHLTIDQTPPQVDLTQTVLRLDQPVGQTEAVVRVSAQLDADTVAANLRFQNTNIALSPLADQPGLWQGQTIIEDNQIKELTKTVVLADLTVRDRAGNQATYNLGWSNLVPSQSNLVDQYLLVRAYPTTALATLFDMSNLFYRILLALVIIALALNIFIQISKQHKHLLWPATGLICLLIVFILI